MASKILLKLIDEAILPAVFTLSAKVLSVAILVFLFQIPWQLSTTAFPTLTFSQPSDLLFVNSYSNLIMFLTIAAGFIWLLTRAHVFHDTHISPALALRLLSWDLSSLLTSNYQIFHKATIWFAFLWLAVLFLGLQVFLGISYLWLFVVAIVIAVFLTWLLVEDLEREMAI